MNPKVEKLRTYMDSKGFTGVILGRQDNFNWITDGGNSRVIVPKDLGHAVIVVTMDRVYLVAQCMDGARIMDEEMSHLEAEGVYLKWFECSPLEKACQLAGKTPVADCVVKGAEERLNDIYDLQVPLSDDELRRMRRAGAISDQILYRVAKELRVGMVDYDVEAMLCYEFAKENMQCDVVLVGTDERVFKYRHPNPCGRKIGKYTMLHAAARSGGLHSNVSRSVYFGDVLPEEIAKPYDTCCRIQAYCMSRCQTGTRWSDILKGQKELYVQCGYPDDWMYHYPGGRTGYFVSQSDLSLDPERTIQNREAYDWFVTATGAKVEELSVNWDGRHEILSHTGIWPSKQYVANGISLDLPQIMLR